MLVQLSQSAWCLNLIWLCIRTGYLSTTRSSWMTTSFPPARAVGGGVVLLTIMVGTTTLWLCNSFGRFSISDPECKLCNWNGLDPWRAKPPGWWCLFSSLRYCPRHVRLIKFQAANTSRNCFVPLGHFFRLSVGGDVDYINFFFWGLV